MAAVDGPYGLRPVNLIGGQPYAGSTRQIPIASAYDTGIFYGDLVTLVAGGTVEKDAGTTAATPVGIFLGCSYTDATMGFIQRQYWPADTVASDAVAYVCDDPDVVFKAALVSGTTVINGYSRADLVGENFSLVQNAGVTSSGNSRVAVLGSSGATTATLPLRCIDVVEETLDASGNYTEALFKWNAGHQYNNTTGV